MHDLIFFFISWQQIIKLIRSKSFFLWYSFTFNVVITHEIITFQDICIDEIPKYFTSIKDTYYAALKQPQSVEQERSRKRRPEVFDLVARRRFSH